MRRPLTRRAAALIVLATSFAGACSKTGEPKKAGLAEAASRVRYTAACRKMAPIEHARSYPLPTFADGSPSFRLFFYPLSTKYVKGHSMPVVEVLAPVVAARLATVDSDGFCERFNVPLQLERGSTLGPRFHREAAILGVRQFEQRQEELYAMEEGVAAAYFAQDNSEAARQAAAEFFDFFFAMSEPGLRPYYYYLSPDFWQWMENLTGKKVFEG